MSAPRKSIYAPWLDETRKGDLPLLREAVQLWLVGWGTDCVADDILADFEPLPGVPPDTARRQLRDLLTNTAKRWNAKPSFRLLPGAEELLVGAEFPEETADNAWDWTDFVNDVIYRQPLGWRTCAWCSKAFSPASNKAVFCSTNCRTSASRKRRTEAEKAGK